MTLTTPARPAPVGVRLPVPALWASAIDDFLEDRTAAGSPVSSRKSYRFALEHLARRAEGGPFDQTRATLRAYIAGHPDWKQETRRARRATMVAFYDWAVRDGLMPANPARQLTTVRASTPHVKPAPESVYQRALAGADDRARLMLRLSHEMGMRRDEVASANTRDLWENHNGVLILDVHGKGRKTRPVPVPSSLARELLALPGGFFFPGKRSGHLSAEYVGRIVASHLPDQYTMHQLRHSYATRLYQETGDLRTVQRALGHSSSVTTERYIADSSQDRLFAAMENMARPQRLAG